MKLRAFILLFVLFFISLGTSFAEELTLEEIKTRYKAEKDPERKLLISMSILDVYLLEMDEFFINEHTRFLRMGISEDNEDYIQSARLLLGYNYMKGNSTVKAMAMLESIDDYFFKKGDYLNDFRRTKFYGIVLMDKGLIKDALRQFEKAEKKGKSIKNKKETFAVEFLKGRAYQALGDSKEAENCYNTFLKQVKWMKADGSISEVYSNLGELKMAEENLDQAKVYFTKSAEYGLKSGRKNLVANAQVNMGIVEYIAGNKMAALEMFQNALEIRKTIKRPRLICESLFNLGVFHFDEGNLDAAIPYYAEMYKIAERNGMVSQQLDASIEFARLYKAKGNLDKSVEYYEKHIELKDGLMKEKLAENNEFDAMYAELKLKELTSASEKKEEQLNAVISKERTKGYIILGLSLLSLGFLAYLFRKKRKEISLT